ncbi:MAG TPA: hypothetical protein VLZ89_02870 [Anaerolineales bacterium]|nr:hypothetical protein [Anaerolineales bacterium]
MSFNRSNAGMLAAGIALIGLGFLFLLGQVFNMSAFWHVFWPFVVIGFGALFFAAMLVGGKPMAFLAIPGSIITVSGLMLLFQNWTSDWASWSYGWTITLISVGLGIYLMGVYEENEHRRHAGLSVMKVGAVLFVIFGLFFGMFFSFFGSREYLFPVLLILLGAYLVVSRTGLLGPQRSEEPRPSESPDKLN